MDRLVVQPYELLCLQRGHGVGFHHRSDLPAHQALSGQVFEQGNYRKGSRYPSG